jgi:capsular polysaccharide biosynthesis protein
MPVTISNILNFMNPYAPKGLIRSADRWIEKQTLKRGDILEPQPPAWRKRFRDEEQIFAPSITLSAGQEPSYFEYTRWSVAPEAVLYYFKNARVLGNEGAVISPDNKLFCEFTYPTAGSSWLKHSCFRRRRMPKLRHLRGWYATISYPPSSNFFHWMLESLPRMSLLEEYLPLLDGLIVPTDRQPFHQQSLDMFGIHPSKLLSVGSDVYLSLQNLFVPKICIRLNPPSWLHNWYKEKFVYPHWSEAHADPSNRRIYISRRDARHRKLVNEDEVIKCVHQFGFKPVSLTTLPLTHQAKLFHRAGSGCLNKISTSISGASAKVRPPCGKAAG